MNLKQIIGSLFFAVGVLLMIFSIHSMHKIAAAKSLGQDVENFFTHNPSAWNGIIKFFGGKAQTEISKYDAPVLMLLISGIVLTISGAVVVIIYRKKS